MKTYRILTYLGALPFIFYPLTLYLNLDINKFTPLFTSYTLIIISFMSGSHWGINLGNYKHKSSIFLISNIITLAGWITFNYLSNTLFLKFSILMFGALLYVDYYLHNDDLINKAYYKLRVNISIIVILCLVTTQVLLTYF